MKDKTPVGSYVIYRQESFSGAKYYLKAFDYRGWGHAQTHLEWTPSIYEAHTWAEKSGAYRFAKRRLARSRYDRATNVMLVFPRHLNRSSGRKRSPMSTVPG